jgi:hypothetical protein
MLGDSSFQQIQVENKLTVAQCLLMILARISQACACLVLDRAFG